MRALGASAGAVRRAERELDVGRARLRRRTRRLAWGAFLVAALASGGGWAASSHADRVEAERRQEEARARQAAAEVERSLYAALDARQTGEVEPAWRHLRDPDEGVRLAALRYLTRSAPCAPALLGALEDASERVRRAAIQLVASSVPGDEA